MRILFATLFFLFPWIVGKLFTKTAIPAVDQAVNRMPFAVRKVL